MCMCLYIVALITLHINIHVNILTVKVSKFFMGVSCCGVSVPVSSLESESGWREEGRRGNKRVIITHSHRHVQFMMTYLVVLPLI